VVLQVVVRHDEAGGGGGMGLFVGGGVFVAPRPGGGGEQGGQLAGAGRGGGVAVGGKGPAGGSAAGGAGLWGVGCVWGGFSVPRPTASPRSSAIFRKASRTSVMRSGRFAGWNSRQRWTNSASGSGTRGFSSVTGLTIERQVFSLTRIDSRTATKLAAGLPLT